MPTSIPGVNFLKIVSDFGSDFKIKFQILLFEAGAPESSDCAGRLQRDRLDDVTTSLQLIAGPYLAGRYEETRVLEL
jgi:hypothetical protein